MTTPPYLPAEDLRDDFSAGSLDTYKWTASGPDGGVAVVSEQLVLTPSTDGETGAMITSAQTYDLTSSYVAIQVIGVTYDEAACWVQILPTNPSGTAAVWSILGGGTSARTFTNIPGSGTTYGAVSAEDGPGQYLRFRESAGTLYWEVSTDGTSWDETYSEANPFDVTALQFSVAAISTSGVSYTATLANCNVIPG